MMRLVIPSLLLAAVVCGCDSQSSTTQPAAGGGGAGTGGGARLALLMKSRQNPFFDRMGDGAEKAAKASGASLTILAIDKETEAEKQAAQLETVIGQGVQAVIVTPADSKAIVATLLQAQKRGVHIVNIDNRIDPDAAKAAGLKIATFIGPDNVEGARKSTNAMIAAIGGEGEVAMLEGVRGANNAEARKKGFQQALEATGGKVKLVAMDTGEWMTEPAQKKMEAMLNQHPGLKGVFCANDMMALGAIQAIASAGKTGKVVVTAYDNLEPAKQAIRAGSLHATVEQHPDRMGEMGVEYALKLIRGESIAAEVPVETDLVTAKELATTK